MSAQLDVPGVPPPGDWPRRGTWATLQDIARRSKVEPCWTCGRLTILNPHRLDINKLVLLRALAHLQRRDRWVRCCEELEIHGQDTGRVLRIGAPKGERERGRDYCTLPRVNATRLAWWGLVEQEEYRVNAWRITPAGALFLQGRHRVPSGLLYCAALGGVRYVSVETTLVHEVRDTFDRAYWNEYPWNELEYNISRPRRGTSINTTE